MGTPEGGYDFAFFWKRALTAAAAAAAGGGGADILLPFNSAKK